MTFPRGREPLPGAWRVTQSVRGFTLLEMLLALSVFALIAVIMGGAMRTGYRSQEKGDARIESTERLRRTAEIVSAQIESSLPLTFEDAGETKSYFQGDHKTLTLATNYSLWEGRRGYVIAEYTVKADPSGKESLFVSEHTIGVVAKNEAVLLTGCDHVEFSYFEKGLTTGEDQWVDQWTKTDDGPDKIRVKLTYHGNEHNLIVPVRAQRSGA